MTDKWLKYKMVLAAMVLMADILAMASCVLEGIWGGVAVFLVLGWISLDYIRICRTQRKGGKWFELENAESEK